MDDDMLTTTQERQLQVLRRRWLDSIFSIERADRKKAEAGVRRTYTAAGVREPESFIWFDGLLEAAIAAEQLDPLVDINWRLPREALRHRERVRQELRHRLRMRTWRQVIKSIGPEHTPYRHEERLVVNTSGIGKRVLRMGVAVPREDSLQSGLAPFDPERIPESALLRSLQLELDTAGRNLILQQRALLSAHMGAGPPGHSSLDSIYPVFARDYPFGFLAQHEFLFRTCGDKRSAQYAGLWMTAHHCAAWWPFTNAAILADRPRELHLDAEGRLHNLKGPAIVYRSGLALHASHGSLRLSATLTAV